MPIFETISRGSTLQNVGAVLQCKRNDCEKYSAFADIADREGYQKAALLFRAMARSEQVQAEALVSIIRKMGGTAEATDVPLAVQSTRQNLATAVAVERRECKDMYPIFIEIAEAEDCLEAKRAIQNTLEADEEHLRMCNAALTALPEGSPNDDWATRQPSVQRTIPKPIKPTPTLLECTPWYWLRSYPPNGSRSIFVVPLGCSSRERKHLRAAPKMPYFVCPRCGYMIEASNYLRCRSCASATCCGCACVRAQRMRLAGKRKRAALLQIKETEVPDLYG